MECSLKAKKKCCMYPDLMGQHGGQPPKRLPPEPYFTTPGIKIHFLATRGERRQMYARAQKGTPLAGFQPFPPDF